LRIVPNERHGAVHLCLRHKIDLLGDFEQRLQHEWGERLAGAQQPIGVAVPPAVIGLLAQQIFGGSRQRRLLGPYAASLRE
jgi:hypothetical protein